MSFVRLDHLQITAPKAREREVRRFYGVVLGLTELDRPRTIPTNGVWFALDSKTELHISLVENPLRPPVSDHFALMLEDLDDLKRRLAAHHVRYDPWPGQAGYERIFVEDPFGNRIEFLAPARACVLSEAAPGGDI